VFLISVGNNKKLPAEIVVYDTSEEQTLEAQNLPFVVAQTQNPEIIEVHHQRSTALLNEVNPLYTFEPLTEGLEFRFLEDVSGIEITDPLPIEYVADGATVNFPVPTASRGIDQVFKNHRLQVENVDYTIVNTDVVFIQPAPTVIENTAYTTGASHVSNGVTSNFDTRSPAGGLNKSHVFVFDNNNLVSISDYQLAGSDVVLDTPALIDNPVVLWSLSNTHEDSTEVFLNSEFIGDGAKTNFFLGNNADGNTIFVFLDGQYQVLGTDYTVPTAGNIIMTVAPMAGELLTIRSVLSAFVSDTEHLVIPADGSTSYPMGNITDAEPHKMMVFVDNVLQDGYLNNGTPPYIIQNGSPDSIVWTGTPPTAPSNITIRMLRNVIISQTSVINVIPLENDLIRITQNPYIIPDDKIRFVYNNWDIGKLGDYRVTDTPTSYDITPQGIFTLDNLVVDETFTIDYHNERLGNDQESILTRMPIIVSDLQPQYNIFDDPSGINTDRVIGTTIIDTTENRIYEWDGTKWLTGDAIVSGNEFYVTRKQEIWKYDGSSYEKLFSVGDDYTTPPLLSYPLWGKGVVSATYSLGQSSNAQIDYPEAYQIVQFEGDC